MNVSSMGEHAAYQRIVLTKRHKSAADLEVQRIDQQLAELMSERSGALVAAIDAKAAHEAALKDWGDVVDPAPVVADQAAQAA